MRVYHSNRLETLASELAKLIKSHPAEPFTPERIVVPHQTMGRWLRLEIARELSIAANINFELPAEFAWSMLRGAVPSLSKAQGFSPDTLRWHLFELLPEFARTVDAAEVRRFLENGDERMRFELAEKLAGVFDRCINFRPDWIRSWEKGATPHWQARLWQLLTEKVPERHWVHALDAFERELARGVEPRDWPKRAFVFGVSALSPSYLDLLERLGGKIELHVFSFNPCEQYWGDILTTREIFYRTRGKDPESQHFEEGNKLLAAWGRGGRDTFNALVGMNEDSDHFSDPGGDSRLAMLQRDVLELRSAAKGDEIETGPLDRSLQIHCCHSAMREAEALHDRLLDLLENDTDIEPADIMILTPDLARYGPMIAAVFEAEGRIPVSLSRYRAADSPTARAFFDLLSLPGTRHGAEAVLAPLDAPSLRARFGIGENSLPAIRGWVRQAGIRRGVAPDGSDAPALSGYTWREGLNRLLMGYAAGETDELALGVAPRSIRGEEGFEAGEEDYATLGKFISYCTAAIELRNGVARPRGAKQWAEFLRRILGQFFDDGSTRGVYGGFEQMREAAGEFEEVGKLIDNFVDQAGRIDCPISFEVVRQTLADGAAGPTLGPARLADGATIGRLAQGQIPPAKVVCAVGMNGDGFPRNPPGHTFDPVERDKRRAGDRDVRHEDRFAFLEALLAARKSFIVSYTGRDQRDDSEIPPSVLVYELADYLAVRFPSTDAADEAGGNPRSVEDSLRVLHPLQPFSPRYFSKEEKNLFSYSRTMLRAAETIRDLRESPPHRFEVKLPEPDASRRKVSLAELARFFADPARGFLNERFGIWLDEEEQAIDEVEPLSLDGLQRWGLREEIHGKTGKDGESRAEPEDVRSLLLARGELPYGSFGEMAYDGASEVVGNLRRSLDQYAELLDADPVEIDLRIGEFHLIGVIPNVASEYMFYWRNGGFRAKDKIEVCLSQLAWVAAGNEPLPARIVYLEKGAVKSKMLHAPDPREETIDVWLETWWRGLSRPLRFFPESSLAYAEHAANDDDGKAYSAARTKWHGHYKQQTPAESDNKHNRLAWNLEEEEDPLSGEFVGLTKRLLAPLFKRKPQ